MTAAGGEPALPDACAEWCRAHSYEFDVLGELVEIDLDWWNGRLADANIPAQLAAQSLDGDRVDSRVGYLRRGDAV